MKGRPRKFRTNYTRKRNRGDNKTGYIIGSTSDKKSVSHSRRGPIETEETFSKGYRRMNNSNADVRTILHWVKDRFGKKGTEEKGSNDKLLFETRLPLDDNEVEEIRDDLWSNYIQADIESLNKLVRVKITRNDRAFREEVEKAKEEKRRLLQEEEERRLAEEEAAKKKLEMEEKRKSLARLNNQISKNKKEISKLKTQLKTSENAQNASDEEKAKEISDLKKQLKTAKDESKKLEFQKYPERRFVWIKELGRTKEFQSTYVIELTTKVSDSSSEEAYPSKNLTPSMSDLSVKGIFSYHDPFPQSEMFTDDSRCFYVGQTYHPLEVRFYQSKDAHMKKKQKVWKFRKITDEYPYVQSIEHMKSLTAKYGFDRSGGGKRSFEFEHYVAWALYKCGYRTWGPTLEELSKNNISTDREWLGEYPFL